MATKRRRPNEAPSGRVGATAARTWDVPLVEARGRPRDFYEGQLLMAAAMPWFFVGVPRADGTTSFDLSHLLHHPCVGRPHWDSHWDSPLWHIGAAQPLPGYPESLRGTVPLWHIGDRDLRDTNAIQTANAYILDIAQRPPRISPSTNMALEVCRSALQGSPERFASFATRVLGWALDHGDVTCTAAHAIPSVDVIGTVLTIEPIADSIACFAGPVTVLALTRCSKGMHAMRRRLMKATVHHAMWVHLSEYFGLTRAVLDRITATVGTMVLSGSTLLQAVHGERWVGSDVDIYVQLRVQPADVRRECVAAWTAATSRAKAVAYMQAKFSTLLEELGKLGYEQEQPGGGVHDYTGYDECEHHDVPSPLHTPLRILFVAKFRRQVWDLRSEAAAQSDTGAQPEPAPRESRRKTAPTRNKWASGQEETSHLDVVIVAHFDGDSDDARVHFEETVGSDFDIRMCKS